MTTFFYFKNTYLRLFMYNQTPIKSSLTRQTRNYRQNTYFTRHGFDSTLLFFYKALFIYISNTLIFTFDYILTTNVVFCLF